jgi:hypothetical protein
MREKMLVSSVATVLLMTAVQIQASIPTPSRYYSFENDLNDVITGANPAVLSGNVARVAWRPAAGTSAVMIYDEGQSMISMSNLPIKNGDKDWTISFWFNPSQQYDGNGILSFGTTSKLYLESNYWGGSTPWLYIDSSGYTCWGGPSLANEEWSFITLTSSAADGLKIYVAPKSNASVGTPSSQGTGALNSGDTLYLGTLCAQAQAGYYWGRAPGEYDEVAIWNKGLTESEVGEVFLRGKAGLAIPEPMTLALVVLGGCMLGRRK